MFGVCREAERRPAKVRLSNNPYSLEKHSFFEYETHFTVMNYGRKLNHKPTAEFVREFEQEHNVKWMDIHEKVKQVIRQVFEAAALVHPEMKSDKSRAMYGVDVMLDSSFQPKILEVTYCPDCMRACTYDMETINGKGIVKAKEFFNYVFGCLFLGETSHVRLSNNPYSLEKHSFFEYETHFTVMNYGRKLNHKPTAEFVREFEQEHNVKWMDIHEKVKQVIRQVFEAAALVHPEMKSDKSRAMYGVDVMLDSSFQPKILEVTYCPDCMRACTYDMETINGNGIVKAREFFNYVFGCLFLGETSHVTPL
ncbi:hypothetical protein F2Q69_00015991 [Brassica cretica]|uniref:Uncharacterized protein n=1 Tax=Brassica cretica TaxID=69181 RepID=A0A8S9QMU1_BRACR|nr:hypothetical protein F2Q69_00015991 [Brassica cretica]